MDRSLAIKIVSIGFYVLFGISILFGVMFAVNDGYTDLLLNWAYVLSAVAIGGALLFMIMNMFKSKKSLIMSLIIVAIFGVIFLISYSLASGAIPNFIGVKELGVTEAISKWSGTSLYMLYILMGISFVVLLYTEIRGAFK
jgi:amino acid transporter